MTVIKQYDSGTGTWVPIVTGLQGATGATGAAGTNGTNGTNGTAATIAVGTTTTGAAGSSASVTNSGTSSAAVFNFTVPEGATGATGATGAPGGVTTLTGTANQIAVSASTGAVTLSIPTSPAFTGTPTAPTAAAGTNSTQIATMASKPWNTAWGVVAKAANLTSSFSFGTTKTTQFSLTFTAVAGRYYSFVYYEPQVQCGSGSFVVQRIEEGATVLSTGLSANGVGANMTCTYIGSFSAGSHTVVASIAGWAAGNVANRGTTGTIAQFWIEDAGPV